MVNIIVLSCQSESVKKSDIPWFKMETGDTNKSENVGNIFDKLADGIGDTSLIPPASIQRNAQSSMSSETSPESVFRHSLIQMMINAQSTNSYVFQNYGKN